MGRIHQKVQDGYLQEHPRDKRILMPFLQNFDITWANLHSAHNTTIRCFFAKPSNSTKDKFGFAKEVLIVYSKYRTLEARVILAISDFICQEPAKSRVERLAILLVSQARDVHLLMKRFQADNLENAHSMVPIYYDDLVNQPISDILTTHLFSRDLFNMRLPLKNDMFFFGREQILRKLKSNLRVSCIRGIFGLRKTGKTSILYHIQRHLQRAPNTISILVDCKRPSTYKRNAEELLNYIGTKLAVEAGDTWEPSTYPDEHLTELLNTYSHTRFVVIFDEVEYISPFSPNNTHWEAEFVPFWQSLWAVQSERDNLSCVIAGVNASIAEVATIDNTQNPLFGIVEHDYITGLSKSDLDLMLQVLGPKLGLHFDESATTSLHSKYGGHPLLTRLACSVLHKTLPQERPLTISGDTINEFDAQIQRELIFYGDHVVGELKSSYPLEYEMLEMLALGRHADYIELAADQSMTLHLSNYGLITPESAHSITIDVVAQYIKFKARQDSDKNTILSLVPPDDRQQWLALRINNVVDGMRELEVHVKRSFGVNLYGELSFPEADKVLKTPVVSEENSFQGFANSLNRSFIEALDIAARSDGRNNYFFNDMKNQLPHLQEALHRLRTYRNQRAHIQLYQAVEENLRYFLEKDLEGRHPSTVDELWFTLQQCILDGLHNSIQIELRTLSQ